VCFTSEMRGSSSSYYHQNHAAHGCVLESGIGSGSAGIARAGRGGACPHDPEGVQRAPRGSVEHHAARIGLAATFVVPGGSKKHANSTISCSAGHSDVVFVWPGHGVRTWRSRRTTPAAAATHRGSTQSDPAYPTGRGDEAPLD